MLRAAVQHKEEGWRGFWNQDSIWPSVPGTPVTYTRRGVSVEL